MRELVVGIAGAGKTRHCLERCRRALDAGERVLYLVPNRDEAALVRRRLLGAAGAGAPPAGVAALLPGILTPRLLARRLLDDWLPGWAERSTVRRHQQLRALVETRRGRLGPLEASARTPGFVAALDALLAELEGANIPPTAFPPLIAAAPSAADAGRLDSLQTLYRDFLSGRDDPKLLDPPSVLLRAAALAAADPARAAGGAQLLVLDGFSHLGPLELALVDALLAGVPAAAVSLCLDPADLERGPAPPFEGLHALARHFLDAGCALAPLGASRRSAAPLLGAAAAGLFRDDAPAAPGGESLRLLIGGTPRDEAEGVLREVRRLLAAGTPPASIAVLYRQERYGDLLAELMDAAGVPFRAERRRPLVLAAGVDLALTLLDWAAGASVRDLPQRLRGFVDTDDALLAELAALGRGRGLPATGTWEALLGDAREREPDHDWAWLDWRLQVEDVPQDGRAFVDRTLHPLLALLAGPLGRRLEAALLAPGGGAELGDLAADARALERLGALGAELAAALPGLRGPAAWSELLRREAELDEPRETLGGETGGVLLGNPFALRLPELETVFVCGLNEGAFPPPAREDPLLRDAERRALGPALPDRAQRQARERYLFYVAATRPSRTLWLSHAERDATGRPLAPSLFLAELKRLSTDWPAPVRLPALATAEKLRDPVSLRALLRDRLLAEARREATALAAQAEAWLAAAGESARLVAARDRRPEPRLASQPALTSHLGAASAGGLRLSASRLEAFAECPYRFLGVNLLGLEAEEDFEPGVREEGRLLHAVLERVYRDPTDDSTLAEHYAAALEELADDDLPGLRSPRFRAGDLRRLALLEGFLRRDGDRLAASGFAPRPGSLESRFALPLDAPSGGVTLSGIVDRVDVDADGREFVLDYKRGEKVIEAPGSESATLFQLALYAIARGREATVAGAAYANLRGEKPLRGYFRDDLAATLEPFAVRGSHGAAWLDLDAWQAWLDGVAERLRAVVAEIRGGRLEPAPREGIDTCERCAIRPICRWPEDEGAGAAEDDHE